MPDRFQPKSIAVIGGEGFVGHHLLEALLEAYPSAALASLDITQRHPDAGTRPSFVAADLTSLDSLVAAFDRLRPELVFHTASPWTGSSSAVCDAVNVRGTHNTILACRKFAVQRLVYTSSAGVVFNTRNHLINVDERLPVPKIGCDPYNITKAKAEAIVLEANGKDGLLTCALRPAGIFGPGDRQAIPGMIQALKNGQTWIQLGANKNLFDWTYIDNVVLAHLLAAARLGETVPLEAFGTARGPLWLTNERRTLLTSGARAEEDAQSGETDDGELVELSASSKGSESGKRICEPIEALPARRHRWDQWAATSTAINHPSGTVPVAGQTYFVTGAEPVPFWDVPRAVWRLYVARSPLAKRLGLNPAPRFTLVIPAFLATLLAILSELWAKISGKPATFRREMVRYTCTSRYHNIEKARVLLGYEPVIGVEEGIRRSVEWFVENEIEEENNQTNNNTKSTLSTTTPITTANSTTCEEKQTKT